jgi:hypothetical protein
MGAGGSILYQNIEAMAPAVASVYRSFGADGGHVLSVRDWSDAFSNISTLGNLAKAWHAYKFQEYTTKNENTIVRQEVTAAQALMTSLTGIIPRTVEDAYLMAESLKDRKGAQEEIRREAIKNLRLGYKSENIDEANKFFRRAQINIESGNFTPQELSQLMNQASKGFESMIDNVRARFAITSEKRMKDYNRRDNQ